MLTTSWVLSNWSSLFRHQKVFSSGEGLVIEYRLHLLKIVLQFQFYICKLTKTLLFRTLCQWSTTTTFSMSSRSTSTWRRLAMLGSALRRTDCWALSFVTKNSPWNGFTQVKIKQTVSPNFFVILRIFKSFRCVGIIFKSPFLSLNHWLPDSLSDSLRLASGQHGIWFLQYATHRNL